MSLIAYSAKIGKFTNFKGKHGYLYIQKTVLNNSLCSCS